MFTEPWKPRISPIQPISKIRVHMIKETMFYGEPRLHDYTDMDIPSIIREYLLMKGTRERDFQGEVNKINTIVSPSALVDSGLFLYGLKDNATNKKAIKYYCEKWARRNFYWDGGHITVPTDLWDECDRKNEEFTNGKDRDGR